ncbi:putative protein N(5)-glutamine methyltransferase [Streptomyces catenulae]|uniref:peptide chain release factor N(5)-glutamine methyltransferase n=1 Tax=Streptomyces catenulae TaxID=66875 RepID=A0ABV2Z7N0_9ACTN|nr:putative protein N(5)-glutamine methyltransferase [Streptomyces catenulae]
MPARHPAVPSSDPSAPPASPGLVARLRAAGCVFAEDEAELLLAAARTPAELAALAGRRMAGLPLEHVLGWAGFCGHRMHVGPGVFVPRRRSEFLVHEAARHTRPGAVVVDLCCGSGALGAALAACAGPVELHAADIDPAAVRCARANVAAAGGHVHEGDLFAALPEELRGRIDVLLANVPYVPTQEVGLLPPEARDHEPRVALDGGADGLDVLRRVAGAAARWLAPGGVVLSETSERQAPAALRALTGGGLHARAERCAERAATVVLGTRPADVP